MSDTSSVPPEMGRVHPQRYEEVKAENARLREALEAFAGDVERFKGLGDDAMLTTSIRIGDLRAARRAIREDGE